VNIKEPLYEIPIPSTALESGPFYEYLSGGSLIIRYTFYDESSRIEKRHELSFSKVRAYSYTAELHCTSWQIDDAYDTLVEVKSSSWVEELLNNTALDQRDEWVMKHYMIYSDGSGCHQIICNSWKLID